MVGTLSLALEVRPVTTRALFGLTKLGVKLDDPRFECGDHICDRPVTSRCPRGQGFVPDLFEVDRGQGLAIVAARAR
jgi:hypothetical protein